ncbi:hypothetical protein ACI1HS_003980 [Vibrio parahaemolyticus]
MITILGLAALFFMAVAAKKDRELDVEIKSKETTLNMTRAAREMAEINAKSLKRQLAERSEQ